MYPSPIFSNQQHFGTGFWFNSLAEDIWTIRKLAGLHHLPILSLGFYKFNNGIYSGEEFLSKLEGDIISKVWNRKMANIEEKIPIFSLSFI